MRLMRWLSGAYIGASLVLCSIGPAAAASGTTGPSFAEVVRSARLVVLVTVHPVSTGGYVLVVERTFKGRTPWKLAFDPIATTPPIRGWTKALIAFADPTTLDARAPTIAWHVTADGRIDPEGYQQLEGLPATLDALIRYFDHLPASTTDEPTALDPPSEAPLPWLLGIALLAGVVTMVSGRRARGRDQPPTIIRTIDS